MKRERGTGGIYPRGNRWWIKFYVNGEPKYEPGGKTEKEAKARLRKRLGEVSGDRFIPRKDGLVLVSELVKNYYLHLELKGAKGLKRTRYQGRHITDAFGTRRAALLATPSIQEYMRSRKLAGKANATINREIGILLAALRLACKQGRLLRVPYVAKLKEDNARQGFFERHEFESIVKHLPEPIADAARFAYLTGWRKGEVLPLRWDAVDRSAREIRLATSKNGRGRYLPLEGELWEIIERRWEARQVEGIDGTVRVSEFVFHHQGKYGGKPRPYLNIDKSWGDAREKAGVGKKLFHDFRRTAARDMVRAGVPETTAMRITGHVTRSMFDRYNITTSEDMREAMRRTAVHRDQQPTERKVVGFPGKAVTKLSPNAREKHGKRG